MSASQSNPDMQNPLFQAFGQMIVEAANREANLRTQLIAAEREIAGVKAEIEAFKAEVMTLRAEMTKADNNAP